MIQYEMNRRDNTITQQGNTIVGLQSTVTQQGNIITQQGNTIVGMQSTIDAQAKQIEELKRLAGLN